jgi:DNA-binding HxlR family transcriptional regulator
MPLKGFGYGCRRPVMKWDALEDEQCSLARTVAVIGDRRTLLILRECFQRTRRWNSSPGSASGGISSPST